MYSEGNVYTKGNSFRALAETHTRHYRANQLKLENYDKWGHWLTVEDGKNGLNFLPSLKSDILQAVINRDAHGKGVDFARTSKNLLSSQAMCFNFFVPLIQDKTFANKLMNSLIGDVTKIEDVQIEFTPSKSIFNDQSGRGGVDCDALMIYKNDQNEKALAVIETKFVEKEFSNCGFRKKKTDPTCSMNTTINSDFSNCLYKSKKHYKYWDVANESGLFRMDSILNSACPFGNELWQLWTNMTLAYAIAKERHISDFKYIVICPKANNALSGNGKRFDQFRKYLTDPERFKVVYLENIIDQMEKIANGKKKCDWINEFIQKYKVK